MTTTPEFEALFRYAPAYVRCPSFYYIFGSAPIRDELAIRLGLFKQRMLNPTIKMIAAARRKAA